MNNPETGNVDAIITALNEANFILLQKKHLDGTPYTDLQVGNDSQIEALRERLSNTDLTDFQLEAYRMGWCPITLSTNLYGWVAGSTLRGNIGGGRWGMTARGETLEQIISWVCKYVTSNPNAVFTCSVEELPEEVRSRIV
jgi:hypothetical protein